MENIRHLEENIWQLDLKVDNETEFVAPYLIKAGNSFILVDIGPKVGIPELERQLQIMGVNQRNLKFIFLTHIHLDHSGGLGTLLKNFPDTEVIVHRRAVSYTHLTLPTIYSV